MVTDIRSDSLIVQLPNGACIHAHSVGSLRLPNLPLPLVAYIFRDADLSLSLMSISELCKAGCLVQFTNEKFIATYDGCTVVHQDKSLCDSLWHITLPRAQPHARASAALYHSIPSNSSTDESFVQFMHAAFGSPESRLPTRFAATSFHLCLGLLVTYYLQIFHILHQLHWDT